MGDLASLHAECKRLVLSLRDGLERLEQAEGAAAGAGGGGGGGGGNYGAAARPGGDGGGRSSALARDLASQMTALTRAAGELEGVWRMHVVREPGTKRDVWKRKVETVVEEAYALRLSLDKFGGREQRRAAEVQERQELMARATGGRAAKGQMDAEAQMASSVGASKRALDEMYETGSQVLVSMAGSRERLKRAHRKVLDVINSVGLGETLLKLIERRHRINVWIMYCGLSLMVVLAVVFVVWR